MSFESDKQVCYEEPVSPGAFRKCVLPGMDGLSNGGAITVERLSFTETVATECRDTRMEMLSIIEQELQLKLDLRSVKEDFLKLLKDFEAYEKLDQTYADIILHGGHNHTEDEKYGGRKWPLPKRKYNKKPCNKEANTEKPEEEKMAKEITTGEQRFIQSIKARDKKVKEKYKSPVVVSDKSIGDISDITKLSDTSSKDFLPNMSVQGPLHSTMISAKDDSRSADSILGQTGSSAISDVSVKSDGEAGAGSLGSRVRPAGVDNIHLRRSNLLPMSPLYTPPRSRRQSSYYGTTDGCSSADADESTPIIVQRSRHLLESHYRYSPVSDSGPASTLTLVDSAQSTKCASRERFMVISDEGSKGESFTEYQLKHLSYSGRGSGASSESLPDLISPTALGRHQAEPKQTLSMQTPTGSDMPHYSINATRDSEANASLLTTPTSDGILSSDVTPSSSRFSPFTSGQESSYKESDGQESPSLAHGDSYDEEFDFDVRVPQMRPKVTRMTSGSTSAGSISSSGPQAPMNSPNSSGCAPVMDMTVLSRASSSGVSMSDELVKHNGATEYNDGWPTSIEPKKNKYSSSIQRGFHSLRGPGDLISNTRPPAIGKEATPVQRPKLPTERPLTIDLSENNLLWNRNVAGKEDNIASPVHNPNDYYPGEHFQRPMSLYSEMPQREVLSDHETDAIDIDVYAKKKSQGLKKFPLLRRIQSFGKHFQGGSRKKTYIKKD